MPRLAVEGAHLQLIYSFLSNVQQTTEHMEILNTDNKNQAQNLPVQRQDSSFVLSRDMENQ